MDEKKMNNQPTIFHITHHKAGSRWVTAVLNSCAPNRFVSKIPRGYYYIKSPIKLGGVYPAVHLSKPDFEALLGSNLWGNFWHKKHLLGKPLLHYPNSYITNWYNFEKRQQPYRKFIIIRDLRDTIVSGYFSFKISHALVTDNISKLRKTLNSLSQEEGLLYLMDEIVNRLGYHNFQLSWLKDEALFKYEDLLADQYKVFEQIIDHCQINIDRKNLHEIIRDNSFESMTGGRQRGQEDITSHQRKGVAGEWKKHFSARVKEKFKQHFDDILIKTGYEKDMNW
ncbi:sulfotransferase domain-containing protein [Moorena sp. SIO3I6]|uniref:sulfotransferase domain-containing protein n=1 Tax=Moorena sp. SIO3I6 TaxID=2607831 RepID=UPI0013FA0311|nr:sulfotransferase domain-containing protein [Moorena sp. SIO3I6]NEP27563.1 sulfotransferase domain-containing protein [Moorena sp. SIO3I6]